MKSNIQHHLLGYLLAISDISEVHGDSIHSHIGRDKVEKRCSSSSSSSNSSTTSLCIAVDSAVQQTHSHAHSHAAIPRWRSFASPRSGAHSIGYAERTPQRCTEKTEVQSVHSSPDLRRAGLGAAYRDRGFGRPRSDESARGLYDTFTTSTPSLAAGPSAVPAIIHYLRPTPERSGAV